MKPPGMPSEDHPPRGCVEEGTFSAQKEKIGVDATRLEAILEGIELRIARFPERSHVIPGTSLRTEMSMLTMIDPIVVVTFAFDEKFVYLLWIDLY
jgi:hypothetical protein